MATAPRTAPTVKRATVVQPLAGRRLDVQMTDLGPDGRCGIAGPGEQLRIEGARGWPDREVGTKTLVADAFVCGRQKSAHLRVADLAVAIEIGSATQSR